ncbi:hypothetical protein BCAR13_80198 [Paraburkholderia caribensis]|nr:hypothetical protein BCAR13_80198 [Paraburkholderia caribensis]
MRPAQFAGSGTVTRNTKVVEVSGALRSFDMVKRLNWWAFRGVATWVNCHS